MAREAGDSVRVQELLQELVRVCKKSSEAAALFHGNLITESGELVPALQRAAAGPPPPKLQLLQEQRMLLAASPFPQKLIEKIEHLKDSGVRGIDRYIWLVGQIVADPDVKKLVSISNDLDAPPAPEFGRPESETSATASPARAPIEPVNVPSGVPEAERTPTKRSAGIPETLTSSPRVVLSPRASSPLAVKQFHNLALDNSRQTPSPTSSMRLERVAECSKALAEGDLYPVTPSWNVERPYLTSQFLSQDLLVQHSRNRGSSIEREPFSNGETRRELGTYDPAVQELLVIDDLLFTMVGIEGKYIRMKRARPKDMSPTFSVDLSMDSSLQELARRILPLSENYTSVSIFAEARSHFKYGLVNHALSAALKAILQDYHAMVAQLEHQFRLGRLSLQGLWYFSQPMMGAMQALAAVVEKATTKKLTGAAILNLLQTQANALAGDNAARALLQKLTQAASAPYFGILERWVCEGVIDDPYGEFLIEENKGLQKESLSQDYSATFWQQRYSLRQEVPGFLATAAETILTTGKYLNSLRECGHSIQIPFSRDATGSGTKRPYLERINIAYNFASAELLKLIVHKFDLFGRLRSVKHYFLVDQGDFLVHFMDTARDELVKRPIAISVEKLQSLLELALRTSVAAADPYHEDLACNVERLTLIGQLSNLATKDAESHNGQLRLEPSASTAGQEFSSQGASGSTTGMETFTLDYKVRWPTSLVISRKALTKYQLIFRHLFHCKHVERQLCITWQAHQATRGLDFIATAISRSYVLCQRMLHFMRIFQHYMTFEVLEPNWHVMESKLQAAKSIDEVMLQHDAFLDKCLKECMLCWPQILKKVARLKAICLQYATAIQWLIPIICTANDDVGKNSSGSVKKDTVKKTRQRRRVQPLQAWKEADDTNFRTTIGKLEEEFNRELKDLIMFLRGFSQTEPYLAHLAHSMQGVGRDY